MKKGIILNKWDVPLFFRQGFSFVEIMVALAVLSVGVMTLINAFGGIQKAIQSAKNKTLATNLAQEKMQIIKQKNYYQVLVTTSPAYNTDFTPSIPYDPGYFPPEDVLAGGVRYKRYTYIQVAREDSGNIITLTPSTPDTGMRLITITVTWQERGDKKKIQTLSLLANPNTVMANAIFNGTVRDATTFLPISNAVVNIAENMGWRDTTNFSGQYTINLSPGNFILMVSANGYFSQMRAVSISANQTKTQDFNLIRIATGTVTGTPWLNDHLVISQVVGSTVSAGWDQEYVEIYNPTTYTWLVNGNIGLKFQRIYDSSKKIIQITYITNSIPSQGFYLFSNTGTVTAGGVSRIADAVWSDSNLIADFPYFGTQKNIIPINSDGPDEGGGAIELYNTVTGAILDQLGWDRNSGATGKKQAPFCETEGYDQNIGLEQNEQYVRFASTSGINALYGPAYDTNNNNQNFKEYKPLSVAPSNSLITKTAISGTPAIGAIVSATDGLSSPTQAISMGNPPYAYFALVDVATGTWSVVISSGNYGLLHDTVTIPSAGSIFNFASTSTFLTDIIVNGFITGRVLNSFGFPIIPAITVSPGGAGMSSLASIIDGRYMLRVSTGLVNVTVNPNYLVPTYISVSSNSIPVEAGLIRSGVDFTLYQGARISGFVTRDGINALPGVAVAVIDSNGYARDQQVSGLDGRWTTIIISTGAYRVEPAVGSHETVTPSTHSVSLITPGSTVFSTTFTVSGAMGYITGSVYFKGEPIKTGALIVVTTATLTGSPPAPPALSTATLTGAPYYITSSHEDGTYRAEVRHSTSPAYRVYAYYSIPSGLVTVIYSSSTSNIQVIAGQTTSGVNFTW